MEGFSSEVECPQSPPASVAYDARRCRFPGCTARYQRKEHLNRHERLKHTKQQTFICSSCGREFRRSDTLRRHLQKQHKIREPLKRARQAFLSCHKTKTRCEGGVPCEECVHRNVRCSFQDHVGNAAEQQIRSSTPSSLSPNLEQLQLNRWEKRKKWINRYFEIFHPHWPFIHKGSFNVRQEPPLLVQSMMAIGMWTVREQSAQSAAVELFDSLDAAIRDQMEKWDASEVEGVSSACFWPMATYQALLLHIILAVVNIDLKPSISPPDLALLKSLVVSCWRLGMFFYPNMLSKFEETDLPSFVWVSIEEVKRFIMALYRLCARLSSSSMGSRPLLHTSELQFPLPSNNALWDSVERDEWESNAKEENMISLKDNLQARWVSRQTDPIEFLDF